MDFLKKSGSSKWSTLIDRKKYVLLVGGIIIALLATSGTTYVLTKRSVEKSLASDTIATSNIEVRRNACKLFTLQDAKEIFGDTTKNSENNANAVTKQSTVSTCSYSKDIKDETKAVAATILVRSSNKIKARQLFEIGKTQDAKVVDHLGDAAYINPDKENKNNTQLNVLKDDSWIIIAITQGESVKNKNQNPLLIAQKAISKI